MMRVVGQSSERVESLQDGRERERERELLVFCVCVETQVNNPKTLVTSITQGT